MFAEDAPGVWIEAIAVTPGEGPDKLSPIDVERAGNYEPDGVVLRLRAAFFEKERKLRGYVKSGIIDPAQATIIAISGIELPYWHSGRTPPEIVRAVYAVNNPVLVINRSTGEVVDRYIEQRNQVKKANGSEISADVFLNAEYSHVSAVIFDDSNWINYPDPPAANFKLVHNAGADVPLPSGWFPAGTEYWWHDGEIESRCHASLASDQ